MTKLDQEVLDALRVYDCSLQREPQWGEDFFGIDPFYIALGLNLKLISSESAYVPFKNSIRYFSTAGTPGELGSV